MRLRNRRLNYPALPETNLSPSALVTLESLSPLVFNNDDDDNEGSDCSDIAAMQDHSNARISATRISPHRIYLMIRIKCLT